MKHEAFILALMLILPGGINAQQETMPPELVELDAAMTAAAQTEEEPDALAATATN